MDKESTERLLASLIADARLDTALLPRSALKVELNRGRSSTYTDEASGLLTPAIKLSERCSVHPRGEIKAIARARIAGLGDDAVRDLVKRLTRSRTEAPL